MFPNEMEGFPVRSLAFPAVKLSPVPVRPCPDPEKYIPAVIIVPLIAFDPANAPYKVVAETVESAAKVLVKMAAVVIAFEELMSPVTVMVDKSFERVKVLANRFVVVRAFEA